MLFYFRRCGLFTDITALPLIVFFTKPYKLLLLSSYDATGMCCLQLDVNGWTHTSSRWTFWAHAPCLQDNKFDQHWQCTMGCFVDKLEFCFTLLLVTSM